VEVFRNDEITLEGIAARGADRLVISPGPCSPNEAGISVPAIRHFMGKLPILGVCLGHQSIGAALGGKIIRAQELMHGKTSVITTTQEGVFAGLLVRKSWQSLRGRMMAKSWACVTKICRTRCAWRGCSSIRKASSRSMATPC